VALGLDVEGGGGGSGGGALAPSSASAAPDASHDKDVQAWVQLIRSFPEAQQAQYFGMSVGEFQVAMREQQAKEKPMYVASGMCFGLAVGGIIGAFRN
jgi:hypothetical protein